MVELDFKKLDEAFPVNEFTRGIINKIIKRSHGFSQFTNENDTMSYYAVLIGRKAFNLSNEQLNHFLNCSDEDFQHDFNGIKYNFPNPVIQPLDEWNGFVPYCAAPIVKGIRPAFLPERVYLHDCCIFPEYRDANNVILMQTDNSLRKCKEKQFFHMSRKSFENLINNEQSIDMAGFTAENRKVICKFINLDQLDIVPLSAFAAKEILIDNLKNIEYLSAEFNVFTNYSIDRIDSCFQDNKNYYLGEKLSPTQFNRKVTNEAREMAGVINRNNVCRETVVEGR